MNVQQSSPSKFQMASGERQKEMQATLSWIDFLLERSIALRERSMTLLDQSNTLMERSILILAKAEASQMRSNRILDPLA